ncbi:hypothetical protein D3C87_1001790 [compost metagenome]
MPNVIRAKFVVRNNTTNTEGSTVTLDAVIDGSDENKEFFKYTPSGHVSLGLVNPATAEAFTSGKEFYLDFTPV